MLVVLARPCFFLPYFFVIVVLQPRLVLVVDLDLDLDLAGWLDDLETWDVDLSCIVLYALIIIGCREWTLMVFYYYARVVTGKGSRKRG
jgi:hypothetical protein